MTQSRRIVAVFAALTAAAIGLGIVIRHSGGPGASTPAAAVSTISSTARPTRRAQLAQACELDDRDAKICLEAAALHLATHPDRFEALARVACARDRHAWIRGSDGAELSCQFFAPSIAERSRQLNRDCRAGTRSCRDLGDLLWPYDAQAGKDADIRACAVGGFSGEERRQCATFARERHRAPSCPRDARQGGAGHAYWGCGGTAKRQPEPHAKLTIDVEAAPSTASAWARASLRASAQPLLHCHYVGWLDTPELSGNVELRVLVDRFGRVASISTSGSTLADPYAVACMARVLADTWPVEGAPPSAARLTARLRVAPLASRDTGRN